MKIIEPHIHMISRTTADYERMARMHTVACCEPSFWAGYDRTSPAAFHDYFTHIAEYEPTRAAIYGIDHYCWIAINPKEAEDLEKARAVIKMIPEFLKKPTVLGIGETGLNKNTKNEVTVLEEQIDLAVKYDQLVWIHSPHLDDKKRGVDIIINLLVNRSDLNPKRVVVDHNEEHTVKSVLDAGFWAALTVYPKTKNSAARVVDAIDRYGLKRIIVDASGDWGPSDPATLHDARIEMQRRGYSYAEVEQVFYSNPCLFLGQCSKFKHKPKSH